MTMLAMVVGTYLIEPVNTTVVAITTPTYSSSVYSLARLLPLFLVIMIILYVIKGFDAF